MVSTFFAVGLTFTPLPDRLRLPVLLCALGCFALSCLGWVYAHQRESSGPTARTGKRIAHSSYKQDNFEDVLWTWDYDSAGRIVNVVARWVVS